MKSKLGVIVRDVDKGWYFVGREVNPAAGEVGLEKYCSGYL